MTALLFTFVQPWEEKESRSRSWERGRSSKAARAGASGFVGIRPLIFDVRMKVPFPHLTLPQQQQEKANQVALVRVPRIYLKNFSCHF